MTLLLMAGLLGLTLAATTALAQPTPATGRVQTVTGPIHPDSLGFTLPHEHLFVDFLLPDRNTGYRRAGSLPEGFVRNFQELGNIYWVPRTPEQLAFWDRPTITLDMLERLRAGWQTKSNYVLDDESEAMDEVRQYLAAGGRSLVDVTPVGIGREPIRLRRVAQRTGLQIVMGTSFYRWPYRSDAVRAMSAEAMANRMVKEITEGIDGTGIRAGIIGEIPIDAHSVRLDAGAQPTDAAVRAMWAPRYDQIRAGTAQPEAIYDAEEIKSLRAAAWASRRTGAAITLHAVDPWIGYLDVLEREGADLRRVVIGHGSWVMADTAMARRAFRRGATVQLEWEMQIMATGETAPVALLLDRVAWAVREGFARQIMLSLDVCLKVGRKRYGGGGLTQVTDRLLPELRSRGVSEADLRIITVDNPARLLTLVEPR